LIVSREVEELEDVKGVGGPSSSGEGRGEADWGRCKSIFAIVFLHTVLYLYWSLIFNFTNPSYKKCYDQFLQKEKVCFGTFDRR
jgi:hypothetical protein